MRAYCFDEVLYNVIRAFLLIAFHYYKKHLQG